MSHEIFVTLLAVPYPSYIFLSHIFVLLEVNVLVAPVVLSALPNDVIKPTMM